MIRKLLAPVAAALIGATVVALAQTSGTTVLVSPRRGDIVFPFTPPGTGSKSSVAGTIDNMVIGQKTPQPGTFSMLKTTGVAFTTQPTPAAKTVSATLTAAELQTKIITVSQGAGAASALQLPLATAMDTALPTAVAGDSFDFSVINISTNAAEPASLTTNTGWTLVGDMDIIANSASTTKSAGRFRATKTGTGTWTLYRIA